MNIKEYAYNNKTQLTKNINVSELKCKCGGTHNIKIDVDHINNIQDFMNKNGYTKVVFSSGYRCSKHDKAVGGSGSGQHTKGTATDQCFYKDGKVVSSKEICCKAQDYGFKGIAYITPDYVHLDNRASGTYRGDETKGYSNNVGNDFYKYFGVEKPKTNQIDVDGIWGKATTVKAQQVFGTTVDGIVSNQYVAYKNKNQGLSSTTFEWEKKPSKNGSSLIKAIQKKIGTTQDGFIGTNTIKAMQKWLGTIQDGYVSRPSSMVKAFQKWLNNQ